MERTLLLWNGRLAEITISAVRTEQWLVLCWKRESCIGLLLCCPHNWINTNMEGGKHLLSITSRRGTPMHLLRLGASQTHVQKDTRSHLHNPHGAHFLPGKWGQAVSTVSWLVVYLHSHPPHPYISETQVEVIEAFPHQHYNTVKHKHTICTLIQPDTGSVLTHWGM